MTNKPTLTIGIPAYNEEHNLRRLLPILFSLSSRRYQLVKIIIASDGSTDGTSQFARELPNQLVKFILNKKRLGKPVRENQIMEHTTSEILVILDADVTPVIDSLDQLVAPLKPSIPMMSSGLSRHFPPKTIIARIASVGINIWDDVRAQLPKHNFYDSEGMIRAFTKPLYQVMKFPIEGNIEDTYSYLYCLSHGYQFRHTPQAVVMYHLPETFHDYLSQQRRYHAGHFERKYFPAHLLAQAEIVTNKHRFIALTKNILLHPFLVAGYILFSLYFRVTLVFKKYSYQGTWEILSSTRN